MATVIEMPKLSDTMTTGTLVKWLKKEGDKVEPGDMIAEVETDKATMELENFEEGVILKFFVAEGDEAPVGGPVCAVGEEGEAIPEVSAPAPVSEEKPEEEPAQEKVIEKPAQVIAQPAPAAPQPEVMAEQPVNPGGRIKASPLAKRIAAEKGIDLSRVQGTGPEGRIVKEDVLKAIENGVSSSAPASMIAASPATVVATSYGLEQKEIKVSNMRGTIARRLLESKNTIPHFYLQTEIDVAPLLALRKSLNANLADLAPNQGGAKFTVNDFILKAATEALRRVPAANSSWMGDKIVQHGVVNMAFAVAVEEGLVTPTINNADAKSLRQISAEAKELIGKARNKKLTPAEMSGSTFTITNLGMYGITSFYGIINPPNGAILSIGGTVKKPVVNEKDEIVVGQRMEIGLSGDHRVVDGAVGAEYLSVIKQILENPALMLV